MTIKLLIPGQREPAAPYATAMRSGAPGDAPKAPTNLLDNVQVLHAFSLSPAAREAKKEHPEALEVEDEDILEIEVEGGFTVWTSAARYREHVALLQPDAISEHGLSVSAIAQPSVSERGVKQWAASALRVLRLKPDEILEDLKNPAKWPDFFKDLVKGKAEQLGAWATAKLLMYLIEQRLTPGPGLYRWAGAVNTGPADLERAQLVAATDLPQGRPLLVFIHGTASRTLSSFGALATPDASLHWQALRESFGEHIYAFEHHTMSDSPIDNAIGLLETLPVGAQLHLVTHSRGGLVGDLLCLTELSDEQIRRYGRRNAEQEEADAYDRRQLNRLRDLFRQKQLRIARYARVACPARGTLLASDNIDEFLSILTNLIGLIPGLGTSAIYQVVKRITLEVVKQRLQPSVIPGIEAMIPESPLVALLNNARMTTGALGVIAGDIEGGNWLKQLGVFITDRFIYEGRDNDLVVNTDSMFFGAHRDDVHYVFHQGSTVNHFNYFRNEPTRAALVRWITAPEEHTPEEFQELDVRRPMPVPTLRTTQKRAAAAQPVVFVLPGIMGSQLKRNGNLIWLDYADLLLGGLAQIRDVDDPQVTPVGLMGEYYLDLCEYLGNSHEVIPFAYDWRKSIRKAAADLGQAVEKALAASGQAIRFVAHSMGGLVVRSFIAQHPRLWEQVCSRPGSRFLMLGTPNRGSYAMVETLLGVASTIRQLALLDIFHSRREIVEIVAGFHGALELLPQQQGNGPDWFTQEIWTELFKINGKDGVLPVATLLRDAQSALAELPIEIPNADRVLYIAGAAASTPCGIEVDPRGRLLLTTTDAGDGRVTYESGKLPGVATWYATAEHGDLAKYKPAFPAIDQLLDEGRTGQLPTSPPATARGVRAKVPYVLQSVLYPTEADFVAGLMGARIRRYKPEKAVGFKVSVVHGDLRHARFPVMVGHYEGDTIAGAEGYLDRRLDGALSQRYQLGIYPGALGTNTVVLREPDYLQKELTIPHGAVIIGLGSMGELAPATLANAVRRGALDYVALVEDQCGRKDTGAAGRNSPQEVGLSLLLIGTNSAPNITVEDSVSALLRAIAQASQEIANTRGLATRIMEIEIIELYADVAIQAAHAVKELASDIEFELDVHIEAADLLREGQGGEVRVMPSPSVDQWRRWIITAEDRSVAKALRPALPAPLVERIRSMLSDPAQVDAQAWSAVLGLAFPEPDQRPREATTLRYIALTDRARAEVRVRQRQPELIDRLVRISICDTRFKPESARTLFELMIPNALKDSLVQQSRLVIVVDSETAAYPWELMAYGVRPVCVETGMVRQLQTASFRQQIRATTVNAAYVVGDPLTSEGVPPLPAAREEAQHVASLLGNRFQVTYHPDRPSAMQVLDGLFARPYRIVHLAGHGHYEAGSATDSRARSGMLLENGLYLTAAEIGQMRQVPDLVFLNCCHLAQVGPEAREGAPVAYNRLAASISRELIEIGVRAVVAAGWAVHDYAANVFARVFYEEMLTGATFGAALLDARRRTWQQFPDCNTWGAYQAYGDPDFGLSSSKRKRDGSRGADRVAAQELLQELEGVRSLETLRKLLDRCPPAWLKRADVLAGIGTAYGKIGEFGGAIGYLQKALELEDTEREISLKVVEQLANIEARWGGDSGQPELIHRAVERLKTLNALAETGERLALLGSAYKRLAQISEGQDRQSALRESADWYQRSSDRKLTQGEVDPYPVLNWLTIEAILGKAPKDAPAWLARARAAAKERFSASRSFWDAVSLPDAVLLERFLDNKLDVTAADDIVAQYRAAFMEAQASEKERNSVLNQLDFIDKMSEQLVGGSRSRSLEGVRHIRDQLAEPGTAPPTGAGKDAGKETTAEKKPARREPAATATAKKSPKSPTKRRKPSLSQRESAH
jgi:pimeloyl-ACP methyl ester carboxylesterase/tetratricopeptide (TPR) repeat protein